MVINNGERTMENACRQGLFRGEILHPDKSGFRMTTRMTADSSNNCPLSIVNYQLIPLVLPRDKKTKILLIKRSFSICPTVPAR